MSERCSSPLVGYSESVGPKKPFKGSPVAVKNGTRLEFFLLEFFHDTEKARFRPKKGVLRTGSTDAKVT